MDNIYKLMKVNRLIKSPRLKYAAILFANFFKFRHLFIRLDPVIACNLRCRMCHFSDDAYRDNNKGIFKEEEIVRLADMFFPKALQLAIGCGAEPTLYKNYVDIIKLGKQQKIPNISFITNGQLLNNNTIEKIIANKLDELILSVHGVSKDVYERFMVNASYSKLLEVLDQINFYKKKADSCLPRIRINYTVNPDNLSDLTGFFHVFDPYDIDTLQIRPIADLGNTSYRNTDLLNHIDLYYQIMNELQTGCNKRKIRLLYTRIDQINIEKNINSIILSDVYRYLSPQIVWKAEFDWVNESYEDFCKRIKWNNHLIRRIFSDLKNIDTSNALLYDIN